MVSFDKFCCLFYSVCCRLVGEYNCWNLTKKWLDIIIFLIFIFYCCCNKFQQTCWLNTMHICYFTILDITKFLFGWFKYMPCFNVAIKVSCVNEENTCNRLVCNYLNVKGMSRGKTNWFSLSNVYILNIHNFDNKTLIIIFKKIMCVLHFISVQAASFPRNTFSFFFFNI